MCRVSGLNKARTISFSGIRIERELAHDKEGAGDVSYGKIGLSVFILEEAGIQNFFQHLIGYGFRILIVDTQKNEISSLNTSQTFA